MMRHFQEELKELRQKILQMGFAAEEAVEKAIDGYRDRNGSLVRSVIENENIVNQFEIDIDALGHRLLALEHPVASDLRLVITILKMNSDIERIADHAENIAKRTLTLLEEPTLPTDFNILKMAGLTLEMFNTAFDSFLKNDTKAAKIILTRDNEVDQFKYDIINGIEGLIETQPTFARAGMNLAMIASDLERIADLASNIAEDVVYFHQAKEVRHHSA